MAYVIDSTGAVSPAAMRAAGVVGSMRYISAGSDWKHIHPGEAAAYLSAGISIGFVTEGATTMAEGGYATGKVAAISGLAAASGVMGHQARVIYLACDEQTSWGSVSEFYRGGRDGVGAARLGVYGSRTVCAGALDAGYCHYAWQPEAWSVGLDSRAQLHQRTGYVHIGGVECDYNEIRHADWGQYPYSSVAPPPVPTAPYTGPWAMHVDKTITVK